MNIKRFFRRIPRPVKACIYAAFVILLAITYYIATGCPTLTFRQEFRRAEKANLVGPSKIVDRLDGDDYHEYDDMLVGETEHGVCFLGRIEYYRQNIFEKRSFGYHFNYREKTGDITVVTAPNFWGWHWAFDDWGYSLPVYIFTEHHDAVSATIKLTVVGSTTQTINNAPVNIEFSEVFITSATKLKTDVLRGFVESSGGSSNTALAVLSKVFTNNGFKEPDQLRMEVPCTVELFDAEGNLIVCQEMILRTDCGMKITP